jgi:adhesin/invasin
VKHSFLVGCTAAAVACALAACGGTDGSGGNTPTQNHPAVPVAIAAVSGDNQTAETGVAFSAPLSVKVTDGSARGVAGVLVTFTVSAPNATLSATSVATDAAGTANVSVVAGSTPGTVTVSAQAAGVSTTATFALTIKARTPAAIVAVSGDNQAVEVTSPYPLPLVVKVSDTQGRAVANVPVNFSNTVGVTTIATPDVTTDAQGLASTTVRSTQVFGVNTVTAKAAGLTAGATFSLTNREYSGAGGWSGTTADGGPVFFLVSKYAAVDSMSFRVSWSTPLGTCTATLNAPPTSGRSINDGAFEAVFSSATLDFKLAGKITGTSATGSVKVVQTSSLWACGTSFFFGTAGTVFVDKAWSARK